jgi:hypothetical protein
MALLDAVHNSDHQIITEPLTEMDGAKTQRGHLGQIR